MVFTGTYEHAIDAKQRLAIPSDIRSQLQRELGLDAGEAIGLYVTLGEGAVPGMEVQDAPPCLCLYTESAFEKRAEQLDASELEAEELLAYERLLFSLARRVELDKQGRVRLPESLLTRARLGQDVVLIGVKDHLEIRDRETWQSYVEQMLTRKPDLLMNPRRAMRKLVLRD